MKYLRSPILGCKDIGIRKSEFVTKTLFSLQSLTFWSRRRCSLENQSSDTSGCNDMSIKYQSLRHVFRVWGMYSELLCKRFIPVNTISLFRLILPKRTERKTAEKRNPEQQILTTPEKTVLILLQPLSRN